MNRTSPSQARARLSRRVALVVGLVAVAATSLSVPSALASESVASVASTSAADRVGGSDRLTRSELRRHVEQTLEAAGYVGLSVEVRDGSRRVRARAGEAELGTGRPVPHRAYFRAGSATKAFVATVVLQLVAEGRLALDDTVEEWLPGVVAGNGNDGNRITIRHLLQHTSGIYNYDYTHDVGDTEEAFLRTRFHHFTPDEMVAGAMRHAPEFPPADPGDPEPDWGYSNPNYLLAGMIIEEVTGRSWAEEVRDRIVRPLGLTGTSAPGEDLSLPEPHAHTYHRFPDSDTWTDTTVRSMTWADAAGALVSTQRDLDRFFTALLGGRLLPPAQLAEMRRTVPVGEDYEIAFPGLRYGLGLMQEPLTCGGHRWGHGGDLAGLTVRDGVTEDGRRSIVVTGTGKTTDDEQLLGAEAAVRRLMDTVLCRGVR
jgi:D-alanyl-D-alanine carboxypeptidase